MKTFSKQKLGWFALAGTLCLIGMGGCQPYNTPKFANVEPNETAFLVPLNKGTDNQQQLQTMDYWKKAQVSAKRIEIPRSWVQLGRFPWEGEYVDAYALLKVSLSPVTREWTEDKETGTSTTNQGIRAETSESTSFMVRMNCSCRINEAEAAIFLSSYGGRQLETVMDTDIRAIIESAFVEEAAKYSLEKLLLSKSEIMAKVRKITEEYCASKGILLNYLGLKGDLTYVNPNIQEALDKRFQARQERLSQEDINRKNLSKAQSDVRVSQMMASSQGQKALEYQFRLKQLENESKRLDIIKEKWDGRAPSIVGKESLFNSLFNDESKKK